jgi:hypothetical protein
VDLSTITTGTAGQDHSWLASNAGISDAQSVTLDVSKFVSGTHYDAATKTLKSGIGIAKITASSLYGPYDKTATDGRQNALYGFLLDEQGLQRADGSLSTSVTAASLRHGDISVGHLPIAAQQAGGASDVTAATTTGQFVWES